MQIQGLYSKCISIVLYNAHSDEKRSKDGDISNYIYKCINRCVRATGNNSNEGSNMSFIMTMGFSTFYFENNDVDPIL